MIATIVGDVINIDVKIVTSSRFFCPSVSSKAAARHCSVSANYCGVVPMAAEDLGDVYPRDPKKLNAYTLVEFDDVIGEPPSLLSLDGVWEKSSRSFNFTKDLCYLILTTLFGIPIAVLCGLKFASLSFGSIWCVTPCVKAFHISLESIRGVYSALVKCVCDPFCESFGHLFRNIRVRKADV
ncbi:caveolin-3-like [Mizuhopecten yessoensis]|uniref:Caveolin n=1 Tax=Mizuhopecten yessoensis TaxID=6573 RepID=A0A210QUW3_MIZYE|nr:caveolin-3-like [Mizuhopecten yessoensis]OWF52529.1 Caveolin-1 [Mizuhopecten yessoensis]